MIGGEAKRVDWFEVGLLRVREEVQWRCSSRVGGFSCHVGRVAMTELLEMIVVCSPRQERRVVEGRGLEIRKRPFRPDCRPRAEVMSLQLVTSAPMG